MTTPTHRCLISADGAFLDYVKPADLAFYPGWIDCTDMSDDEMEKLVAEKLSMRPYIVGLAM